MTTCADSPRRGRAEHPIFPMRDGERQVAPTLEGIRRDHVARYEWAARRLKGRVLDACCGIGYGTQILAKAGCTPLAWTWMLPPSPMARTLPPPGAHASSKPTHRRSPASSTPRSASRRSSISRTRARCFARRVPPIRYLIASVPNEAVLPWNYTTTTCGTTLRWQFERLLAECGWR
jgi:hypothetical protein